MKRPYSTSSFETLIHKIHGKLPFAGIGVDIIIGFPSETDAQFENTFRFIEKLPVSYLHVFPFSARKGTPAYHFKGKVACQPRQKAPGHCPENPRQTDVFPQGRDLQLSNRFVGKK